MKFNKHLMLTASLILAFTAGMTSCGDEDESCSLKSSDCREQGKKLDRKTCTCVEPEACTLTCDANQTLDEINCKCVDSQPECTVKECGENQEFDTAKCDCVEKGTAACTLDPNSCKENETFNSEDCKCVSNSDPDKYECSKTCTEGQELDTAVCECVKEGTASCTYNPSECKDNEVFDPDACTCVGKSNNPECDITECPQGTELDYGICKCVDPTAPKECTKIDCGENEVFDTNLCMCVSQGTESCTKECDSSKHQTLNDNCECVCTVGFIMNGNNCEEISTCGNGKIDDGEFCDVDSEGNSVYFTPSDADCKKWKHGDYEAGGVPSCNDNCTGYKDAGTCVVKTGEKTCGNNKLDNNEFCDTVNGTAVFSDPENATCAAHGFDPKIDGKLGCSNDCTKIEPGSCVSIDLTKIVQGFHSCSATFNYDPNSNSVKASAEYNAVNAEPNIKGVVICGLKSQKAFEALSFYGKNILSGEDNKISGEFHVDDVLPDKEYYGDYTCAFYIEDRSYQTEDGYGIFCTDKAYTPEKTMGEYNSETYFTCPANSD